jgi:hypothetical protein
VITRRAYGFRTYHAMATALYHNLGRLPEPELTHRFCILVPCVCHFATPATN